MADRDLFDELLEQGLAPVQEPGLTTWDLLFPPFFPTFNRVTSKRFTAKVGELKAYDAPELMAILVENSRKDIEAAEDALFLATIEAAVGGLAVERANRTFFPGAVVGSEAEAGGGAPEGRAGQGEALWSPVAVPLRPPLRPRLRSLVCAPWRRHTHHF